MAGSVRYVIVSPVRNEARNIEETISSVCSQSVLPLRWVIVDDGSTDGTADIVSGHLESAPWMELVRLEDRGYYDLMEGGEIKAFHRGLERVRDLEFGFLSKLDGDISFRGSYFESLFRKFGENPRLGIASGACYNRKDGGLVPEKSYRYHVRGAARVYRKDCWDAIGGTIAGLGWDAMDVYKARMLGWETESFEDIRMIHHVKTWAKGGLLHGRARSGRMEYLLGTHPVFFGGKLMVSMFRWPYLVGAACTAYGYISAGARGEERISDPELITYIRKEQKERMRRAFRPGSCLRLF